MSFLALDVGNTRLKWMLFDHPAPGARALAQGVAFLEQIDRLKISNIIKIICAHLLQVNDDIFRSKS